MEPTPFRVAVIVAHPDDETLWAGGLLLSHPEWSVVIVTLCRGQDPDRAPRFQAALKCLGAVGAMGDLDDGPEQAHLAPAMVKTTILSLLVRQDFDRLLTHGPKGEYTSHHRHEEVSKAVEELWREGVLRAPSLWQFAYEDAGGGHFPEPRMDASFCFLLSEAVWKRKNHIISDIYGFSPESWEARVSPRTEAFDCFERTELGDPLAPL